MFSLWWEKARCNFGSEVATSFVVFLWPSASLLCHVDQQSGVLVLLWPAESIPVARLTIHDKVFLTYMSLRKRPATGPQLEPLRGTAVEGTLRDATEDLIQMGPQAVREALEAQSRYCRKRHKEHAHKATKGEDNKIRTWAKLMGIPLGYQVANPSAPNELQWRHKAKRALIDEIVDAVGNAQ